MVTPQPQRSLQRLGSDLIILTGDTQQQLLQAVQITGADGVYWNRCYEPELVKRDQSLKTAFKQQGIVTNSYNGSLLREPWEHLKKDDKAGIYLRRWVPELKDLDNKYIHQPWAADSALLADAGITLGKEYPEPLVDLKASRREALAVWDSIKRIDQDSIR